MNPLSLLHIPIFVRLNMAQLGRQKTKNCRQSAFAPHFWWKEQDFTVKKTRVAKGTWIFPKYPKMAVCQNLVPLVNIKIAGKWMFIPLKMVLIGIDPYPNGKESGKKNQEITAHVWPKIATKCWSLNLLISMDQKKWRLRPIERWFIEYPSSWISPIYWIV